MRGGSSRLTPFSVISPPPVVGTRPSSANVARLCSALGTPLRGGDCVDAIAVESLDVVGGGEGGRLSKASPS